MRTFTIREMTLAMDRYNEVVTGTVDYWVWLAVNWNEALEAQRKDLLSNFSSFHISDAAAARLDLLLSPHYRTLMKAYQIKYEVKHEA